MPIPAASQPTSPSRRASSTSTLSAFVDYATTPYHDHEAAKNPIKPVLATACLKRVFQRARFHRMGKLDVDVITDEGSLVQLLKEVLGLVDNGTDDDGDAFMSPAPPPSPSRARGTALLHRRYSVALHPDAVLSRDGLTCWVVVATDTAFDDKRVAIKIYKAKFAAISAQETDTNRRLSRNDPYRWANLVQIYDSFQIKDYETDEYFTCVVMELLDPKPLFAHERFAHVKELKTRIPGTFEVKSRQLRETLDDIRKVAFELVKTVGYLKWQRVIHSDLKPENILVSTKGDDIDEVRLIDFGNAISDAREDRALYFDKFQLQARLYRAPEVYFGMENFSFPIDMWSLGCILAELYSGEPLFLSDEEQEILERVYEILGAFPRQLFITGRRFDEFRRFTLLTGCYNDEERRWRLMNKIDTTDVIFTHFLSRCMEYDAALRLTPEEALSHPFLAPLCPYKYVMTPKPKEPRATRYANYEAQLDDIMGRQAGSANEGQTASRTRTEESFQRIASSQQRLRRTSVVDPFQPMICHSFRCQIAEVKIIPTSRQSRPCLQPTTTTTMVETPSPLAAEDGTSRPSSKPSPSIVDAPASPVSSHCIESVDSDDADAHDIPSPRSLASCDETGIASPERQSPSSSMPVDVDASATSASDFTKIKERSPIHDRIAKNRCDVGSTDGGRPIPRTPSRSEIRTCAEEDRDATGKEKVGSGRVPDRVEADASGADYLVSTVSRRRFGQTCDNASFQPRAGLTSTTPERLPRRVSTPETHFLYSPAEYDDDAASDAVIMTRDRFPEAPPRHPQRSFQRPSPTSFGSLFVQEFALENVSQISAKLLDEDVDDDDDHASDDDGGRCSFEPAIPVDGRRNEGEGKSSTGSTMASTASTGGEREMVGDSERALETTTDVVETTMEGSMVPSKSFVSSEDSGIFSSQSLSETVLQSVCEEVSDFSSSRRRIGEKARVGEAEIAKARVDAEKTTEDASETMDTEPVGKSPPAIPFKPEVVAPMKKPRGRPKKNESSTSNDVGRRDVEEEQKREEAKTSGDEMSKRSSKKTQRLVAGKRPKGKLTKTAATSNAARRGVPKAEFVVSASKKATAKVDSVSTTSSAVLESEEQPETKKPRSTRQSGADGGNVGVAKETKAAGRSSTDDAGNSALFVQMDRMSLKMRLDNIVYHKYSPIFNQPIRDKDAPDYYRHVKRPIDITTIRKKIKNGNITSFGELKRDILLMFTNALMYNSREDDIFRQSAEMMQYVVGQIRKVEFELATSASLKN